MCWCACWNGSSAALCNGKITVPSCGSWSLTAPEEAGKFSVDVHYWILIPRYEHFLCQALSNNKPPKQPCMNKELGITPDVKVLIVIRLIDWKTTCGKLKSELGVSRIMSSGKCLKNDHIFMNNEIIHALGRLHGGMEVNFILITSTSYHEK